MNEAYSPLLQQLIEALKCLPGVGQKSAQRMSFHLLQRDRQGARVLADKLAAAAADIGNCERCRMLTEENLCRFCSSARRDDSQICIVETPADLGYDAIRNRALIPLFRSDELLILEVR